MAHVIIDARNARSCRQISILSQTATDSSMKSFTVQLTSISGFRQVISPNTSTVIINSNTGKPVHVYYRNKQQPWFRYAFDTPLFIIDIHSIIMMCALILYITKMRVSLFNR